MKSVLLILVAILLIASCDNTSNHITMPTEPQTLAKTVDNSDTFKPFQSKGKGPFDKTTGDVARYRFGSDAEYHWIFNAHDFDGIGKGKVMYTLSSIASGEVNRTREFNVIFVSIGGLDGNEGWFVSQCTFDTEDISIDNWYVFYVKDGGEPGVGQDKFGIKWINDPDAENVARNMVDTHNFIGSIRDIHEGNIQVHQY